MSPSILLLVLGVLAFGMACLLLIRALQFRSRRDRRLCPRCRFDLRGMPEVAGLCPECGTRIEDPALLTPRAWSWRWRLAVAALLTAAALTAVLHAQGPRHTRLCMWLAFRGPAAVLVWLMPTQPRIAAAEMVRRIDSGVNDPAASRLFMDAALADLDRGATTGLASPGVSVMRALRRSGAIAPDALGDLLGRCLPTPAVSSPGQFRTSGTTVTLVAGLQPTSRALWIGPDDLHVQVESARLQALDGSWIPLERRSPDRTETRTRHSGGVFVVPAGPGTWTGELTVQLEQVPAGDRPFRRTERVPFTLTVEPRPGSTRNP